MTYGAFLSPTNDYAFRRVFGSEKYKSILIAFLNDVLVLRQGSPIQEVSFLKTIQDPEVAARKTSIVDVLCRDEKGHLFIVEMQVAKTKGFEKRAQYYAAKAYTSQLKIQGEYLELKEVIFLAIVDFVMFPQKEEYKSDHVILDHKTHEQDLKDFSFTFIELPKMKKDFDELQSMTDKWCYFLKYAQETSLKTLDQLSSEEERPLKEAYQALYQLDWTEEELRTYEQQIKQERDYEASMSQKYDDGLQRGRQEGLQEGIEKGREEEKQKLLAQGLDPEVIKQLMKGA